MSGRLEVVSSDREIWDKIDDPGVREDWAVQQAAHSTFVQAPLSLFVRFGYENLEVKEAVLDGLAEVLIAEGEVPKDRIEEVFGKAEYLITQGLELNGEA